MSPDLRELLQSPGTGANAKIILQADDVNDAGLRALLRSSGVKVNAAMDGLGALEVELPLDAVEQVAASNMAKHLSLDRDVNFLGHVETTTGAAAMRAQTGNSCLDGTGIGIAILDSSIYNGHHAFLGRDGSKRIVAEVDFSREGMDTDDPYGHGTHVAGLAAGRPGKPGDSKSTHRRLRDGLLFPQLFTSIPGQHAQDRSLLRQPDGGRRRERGDREDDHYPRQ